jgi:hypothetical protein
MAAGCPSSSSLKDRPAGPSQRYALGLATRRLQRQGEKGQAYLRLIANVFRGTPITNASYRAVAFAEQPEAGE